MKKFFALFAALLACLLSSVCSFAIQDPDAPGSKLVTVQVGATPGFGGIVSGNVAMARLGSGHLYGGLQAGANFSKGSYASRTDFSLAPRVMVGFNLSQSFELHFGALAGIAARKLDETYFQFCYGGFGGLRVKFSPSVSLIAEGYYSPHLSYASLGLGFTF